MLRAKLAMGTHSSSEKDNQKAERVRGRGGLTASELDSTLRGICLLD